MKFIVIAHSDKNKLIRCLSSICSNTNRNFSIDVLCNKANFLGLKKIVHSVNYYNHDIEIKIRKFNVHIRDRYMSNDILMLRKYIQTVVDEFCVICDECVIFTSTYIQDIKSSFIYNKNEINIMTGESPLDTHLNGNGGCVYRTKLLKSIPKKQWRTLNSIQSLYLWYFSEFCQSKQFFENIIDAEENKKFYLLPYKNVVID